MTPPRKFSALPPQDYHEASPKAISRRTSYLRVRLEFLPYPHLIATLFNGCAFGPPLPFTATSTWTWVDHPVSGLRILTNNALFRLGIPSAPRLNRLTLPVIVTRRTVLQKVRGCRVTAVRNLLPSSLADAAFSAFLPSFLRLLRVSEALCELRSLILACSHFQSLGFDRSCMQAGRFLVPEAPNSSHSASTACKHRVSGSLSLPSRGPFHLSFTVLFSIGH